MQFVLLSIGVFVCQLALAVSPSVEKYYGSDFISAYESGSLKDQTLLKSLQEIISNGHHALGYDGARRQMFGKLYLEHGANGYAVKDVYCEKIYTEKDVKLGPGVIPDGNVINTEHTWPQSRFTNRFPKEVQKSDLHHLFPTDNYMNSHRGNLRFGEVVEDVENLKCPIAHVGHGATGDIVFEVPENHKGNAARAIFYFATRYEMQISDDEEAQLRDWAEHDPVDEEEAARNDEIQKLQGNRNPYIDFPDLMKKVGQF